MGGTSPATLHLGPPMLEFCRSAGLQTRLFVFAGSAPLQWRIFVDHTPTERHCEWRAPSEDAIMMRYLAGRLLRAL